MKTHLNKQQLESLKKQRRKVKVRQQKYNRSINR